MDLSNARALTIKQPWASLIACGAKAVENRTWPIPRTWEPASPLKPSDALLIHAGAGIDRKAMTLPYVESDLVKRGIHGSLPHSAILAVVGSVTCHQARWGCCTDFYAQPDGWHWVLRDLTALAEPVPATGRLGLWRPDSGLLDTIEKRLAHDQADRNEQHQLHREAVKA